jgi:hypothetical protein
MDATEPKYPTGAEVHAGDTIRFDGRGARVVFVTQRGEYEPDFPAGEWAFVQGDTIAIQFDDGEVMMYGSFCGSDEIVLLARRGAA